MPRISYQRTGRRGRTSGHGTAQHDGGLTAAFATGRWPPPPARL